MNRTGSTASPVAAAYSTAVNRESAYEKLQARTGARQTEAQAAEQAAAPPTEDVDAPPSATPTPTAAPPPPPPAAASSHAVQFPSADARAVDSMLAAVRGVAGVQSASTSSIAIGGTSVMRVTYAGDLNALAAALRARGWQVTVGSGALSIRR